MIRIAVYPNNWRHISGGNREEDIYAVSTIYRERWITRTAGNHQNKFEYEKFELWVMLSLYISPVAM